MKRGITTKRRWVVECLGPQRMTLIGPFASAAAAATWISQFERERMTVFDWRVRPMDERRSSNE